MSDQATQRELAIIRDQLERLRKSDVNALYLPWSQRVLNPFPLASSGSVWGDVGQAWSVLLVRFTVSVFVSTTNNGTNFWTIDLIDPASTLLCQLTTSAVTASTWTRLSSTLFVQPSATNPTISLRLTATLSPGTIYVAPALAILRTG